MESLLPLGGMGLSFPRRITRLYNDTKKSTDFVTQPVQNPEDPEIKALHRKLRIQKDRLVSWGLEWSDPNLQSAEIDESLSKAGLSDLVGSIMSTIKDILAEAEPLWQSSKRLVGEKGPSTPADIKSSLIVWDKTRFADLVRDLTTSIDTLYDLSRTRSSAAIPQPGRPALSKSMSSTTEDLRPFESSRMETPQEIDPKTLTNATTMEPGPLILGNGTRDVVFMSKQAYSDLAYSATKPWAPLLLEYAEFDPIYATTGIMPSMTRFEKLCAGLQMESPRETGAWNGLPSLLGFFEDMEHARLGLVYQFPHSFNPVSQSKGRQNTCSMFSLSDLLARPDFEPTLEAKFRLANNLANSVFDMHARGISHGNLSDQSILFCNAQGTSDIDIRKPVIASFELFPDSPSQEPSSQPNLYRHPLDPRTTPASPLASNSEAKSLDLWSLAMILSAIATWCSLENLAPNAASPCIPESILDQIAIRCGTLYKRAVEACWKAVDEELAGRASGEVLVTRVQVTVSRYLEACCILDSVSGLEDRLKNDLGESAARVLQDSVAGPSKTTPSPMLTKSRSSLDEKPPSRVPEKKVPEPVIQPVEYPPDIKHDIQVEQVQVVPEKKQTSKMRLYPNIPLPPDAVEQWNAIIMPQINAALKSFYRKHPESVELSLESIGESPQQTQPTVLVVCTSVSKVRTILKKKLGPLFDGSTQFALKVCKGSVLRSRKSSARRSMALGKGHRDEEAPGPVNGGFQERPHNGASIGAWIGDRHLPPVSFGGLIVVDDKPYGMTVHHMLDDPDQDGCTAAQPILRSSGFGEMRDFDDEDSFAASSESEDYACEFSDDDNDSEFDESDITSDDDEEEEEDEFEPGDIPGVEPGCGDGYIVTQPALDDVDENFFASDETADEEHLDSFGLGDVYASSGIRRREQNGLIHEIDWALFEFHDERLPNENSIPRALSRKSSMSLQQNDIHPTTVAPTSSLPGLEVQCIARTSGLQTGTIMPALTSVKIYGRTSPSHTYQVCRSASHPTSGKLPMGIPGDSGAWVIDRQLGRLCGHVLAWSERKQVAYICPMDILLLDIAETLEAGEVKLPGGESVVRIVEQGGEEEEKLKALENPFKDHEEGVCDDGDDAPALVEAKNAISQTTGVGDTKGGASFEQVEVLGMDGIASKMDEMHLNQLGLRVPS